MSIWEGLNPPYRTIVADPPWRFTRPGGGTNASGSRGATKAAVECYSTMSLDDAASLPVADLADGDAHLWCWAVNGLMEEAHRVVRAWGFSPLTIVTWCKSGPGIGHYLRNNTEHLILASRGKPMVPEVKPLSTWFEWSANRRHSVKPAAAFDLIEQVSPGPYVELFARQPRLGWDHWGNGYESVLLTATAREGGEG